MSRSHKNMKRRKNNRNIFFFILLAILFFVILLFLIFSGNKDETPEKNDKQIESQETNENGIKDNDNEDLEDNETQIEEVYDVVIEKVNSDDPNVIEAFRGNWPPIGTVQEEPHTTDYTDGSQDRIEIKRAISLVTKIDENDMTELWVGNDGHQKVVATVTNKEKTEIYRIYLTWVENEGWQVTLGERIKEYKP